MPGLAGWPGGLINEPTSLWSSLEQPKAELPRRYPAYGLAPANGDWNTATSWVLDSLPRGLSPPAYWAGWTDRVTVVPVRHQCPAVKREVQVPTERRPSRPTPFALDSHHGQRAATQVTPYRPDRPPAPETGSVTGGPGSNTSRTLRRESCSRSREA
jgi:hypothetical protein